LNRRGERSGQPREKIDGEDEGSPPPRDSEETTTTVFWSDDEGPVVMVWDGMTQEEQVIAQTVISGEKDWVIWTLRVKVPQKVRKRVRRRPHKKERLVSPK
jgi:hypothetical protein